MIKNILKGFQIGIGFILAIGILFGIVYAVGFHNANEVLSGTFQGNYTFNGTMNFTPSTTIGLEILSTGMIIGFNSTSCPDGWNSYSNLEGTQISQGMGTAIGSLTGSTDISKAYDGNKLDSQTNQAGATANSNGPEYIGKDWGTSTNKTIYKVLIYGTSDRGYWQSGGAQVTLTLQGSNDNFTSNINNLGTTGSFADANSLTKEIISNSTTSYRYHRISMTMTGASGQSARVSELEFIEAKLNCEKQ